ncbi:unnamed protein product [Colias eurytheme]|nr:unnamed protein product [Colias eurytheme]
MVLYVQSLILKCVSLGCVIAAGGLWAGSEVDTRPKNRDEQTLVGGAIWSQTLIPLGLIISLVVEDGLYVFVHGYFLLVGSALLITTGMVLTFGEWNRMKKVQRSSRLQDVLNISNQVLTTESFDKIYLSIGLLCLLAGVLTFADLIVIVL